MLKVESTSNVKKGVFENLNLTLDDSGLVFICGIKESDSSKLQKIIAGVTYDPDIKVSFNDKVIESEKELDDYRLQNMGFVFGNSQKVEDDTVLYNTIISTVPFSEQLTDEKIDEVLTITKLIDKKNTKISELSEYELHLLDIARALMKEPKIIYANNPIARLNDEEANKIWTLLKEISENCLVVVGNATVKTAEHYGDKIISFNDHSADGKETIEIRDINQANAKTPKETFNKNNQLSFSKCLQISLRVLKSKIIVIILMTLTLSIFLYGSAIKNDSHLKFAKALSEAGVTKVYVERQNDANNLDQSISGEYREEIEGISSDIKVQWSNYLSKDPIAGYDAHLKSLRTNYRYPDSLFMLEKEEYQDIDLLYGTYTASDEVTIDETTGVYLSVTEAREYIEYYKSCTANLNAFSNTAFKNKYLELYPDEPKIKELNEPADLIGEYIIYAFSSNFTDFKIAGIYEDSDFDGRIFLSSLYKFKEGYDRDKFFSLGVVTLSKNLNANAKLLSKYASVVRNEREMIVITTSLDAEYNKLYASINKIPGTANLVALILLIITICGSAIMSFLLVSTYRSETVLARTYGLKLKEAYKVSTITNAMVAIISTVISIIIVLIVSLISNVVIKNSYAFIKFNYVMVPLYGYLVALLALVLLTVVFTFISISTLKKKDYIVY